MITARRSFVMGRKIKNQKSKDKNQKWDCASSCQHPEWTTAALAACADYTHYTRFQIVVVRLGDFGARQHSWLQFDLVCIGDQDLAVDRSEERRVGKECR